MSESDTTALSLFGPIEALRKDYETVRKKRNPLSDSDMIDWTLDWLLEGEHLKDGINMPSSVSESDKDHETPRQTNVAVTPAGQIECFVTQKQKGRTFARPAVVHS